MTRSETEIAYEVALEMILDTCNRDFGLAKASPEFFLNQIRRIAERGLTNGKSAKKEKYGLQP